MPFSETDLAQEKQIVFDELIYHIKSHIITHETKLKEHIDISKILKKDIIHINPCNQQSLLDSIDRTTKHAQEYLDRLDMLVIKYQIAERMKTRRDYLSRLYKEQQTLFSKIVEVDSYLTYDHIVNDKQERFKTYAYIEINQIKYIDGYFWWKVRLGQGYNLDADGYLYYGFTPIKKLCNGRINAKAKFLSFKYITIVHIKYGMLIMDKIAYSGEHVATYQIDQLLPQYLKYHYVADDLTHELYLPPYAFKVEWYSPLRLLDYLGF
jgi:hypothetical protein